MSENKVGALLEETMRKLKDMVDVNTVIGDPINTADGTTIIPISRVNYGFASGGSDLPSKAQPNSGLFAGGAGAAATVTPIAFLTVYQGNVRVIQIEPFTSSIDRIIQTAPDIVDKITSVIKKKDDPEPINY